jgi:hypothetical protein
MPPQRIRPDAADAVDLGEELADEAGYQDGLDLEPLLGSVSGGQ